MPTGVEVVSAFTDTSIRNAIAAVQAESGNAGGVVLLPAGTYLISATVVIPQKITLQGAGKQTTILIRQSDITAIDISGQAGGANGPGGVGGHIASVVLADLQVQGNNSSWTSPLVRLAYAHTCEFRSCTFAFANCVAFYIQCEVWDTTWYECRWDNSGGTNTGKPAMLVQSADGTAFPGFGSSTDSTNDLRFYHCTWEGFKDGAFWAKSGQSGANAMGNFYFEHCKADQNVTALGDWMRFEGLIGVFIRDMDLASTSAGSAYAGTPFNIFTFQACKTVEVSGITLYQNSSQTNSLLYFDGTGLSGLGNRYVSIGPIDIQQINVGTPFATGPIVFKGTNLNYRFDVQALPRYTTGAAAAIKPLFNLESGTVTYPTVAYKPIGSKAGAYTDAADIGTQDPGLPVGLATIAGYDTTNDKLYIRRPDGTYKSVTFT